MLLLGGIREPYAAKDALTLETQHGHRKNEEKLAGRSALASTNIRNGAKVLQTWADNVHSRAVERV